MTSMEEFDAWRDEYGKHSDPCAWPAWQAATAAERERAAQSILTGIDLQHIMHTVYGPYTVDLCNALAEAIRKGPTP